MYLQGVDNVFDLEYSPGVSYGDVFLENERQQSTFNFEESDPAMLKRWFEDAERMCTHLRDSGAHGAGGFAESGVCAKGGTAENADRGTVFRDVSLVHNASGVARIAPSS